MPLKTLGPIGPRAVGERVNKEPEVNLPAPVNRRQCSHRHLLHPRFEVEQKRG
jgi:hypothetical protein